MTMLIVAGKGDVLVLFVSPSKLVVEFASFDVAQDMAALVVKKSFGCVSISDSALLAPGGAR
jgi:hypothetical protein